METKGEREKTVCTAFHPFFIVCLTLSSVGFRRNGTRRLREMIRANRQQKQQLWSFYEERLSRHEESMELRIVILCKLFFCRRISFSSFSFIPRVLCPSHTPTSRWWSLTSCLRPLRLSHWTSIHFQLCAHWRLLGPLFRRKTIPDPLQRAGQERKKTLNIFR